MVTSTLNAALYLFSLSAHSFIVPYELEQAYVSLHDILRITKLYVMQKWPKL